MEYVSTRQLGSETKKFTEVLIEGLAQDGGLFLPKKYVNKKSWNVEDLRGMGYHELAAEVMTHFISEDDIPRTDLEHMIGEAYTPEKFGSEKIVPVTQIAEGMYIAGLSEGPTLAFKDMALQLVLELMDYELKRRDDYLNVLLASSGDTVSAAMEAAIGKERVTVTGLTPFGKMANFQEAQAYSILEPNIHNIALTTVFDGCQDIVKEVNADIDFKKQYHIGALNSINWGRIAAQVVYYFSSYFDVTQSPGEQIDVAVPSGNFGNILAGYIAKEMGVPIRNLILATNENNVLDDFFRTGLYKVRAKEDVYQTSSPSMDISKASNFERFLYDMADKDPETTRHLMGLVQKQGGFNLNGLPLWNKVSDYGIVSGMSTHADRMETIKRVYDESGIIIDTHTADGVKVATAYQDRVPMVVMETAKCTKFEADIEEAIGFIPERPEQYKGIEDKEQKCLKMDPDVNKIKDYIRANAFLN